MSARTALCMLVVAAALAAPSGALASTPSTTLSAKDGMRIDGHLWRQHAGSFVAPAGDFNGDGRDDVLVGTSETHSSRGTPLYNAYVVFGVRGKAGRISNLGRLGSCGLRVVTTGFGFTSGAGAGDVNGGGLDDIVLGKGEREGTRGAAFVVFGRRAGGTVNVARLGSSGITISAGGNAENFGRAVAGASDLDRDGFDDVLLGDPEYVPRRASSGPAVSSSCTAHARAACSTSASSAAGGARSSDPAPIASHPPAASSARASATPSPAPATTNGDKRPDVLVGAPFSRRVRGRRLRGPDRGPPRLDLRSAHLARGHVPHRR